MRLSAFVLFVVYIDIFVDGMKLPRYEAPEQNIKEFDLNVTLTAILSKPFKNVVVSPLAARWALCKLATAAHDKTREELFKALQLDDNTLQSCFGMMAETMMAASHDGLLFINKLYVPYASYVDGFVSNGTLLYNINVENVNFDKSPNTVRTYINNWIDKNTFSRIRDILDVSDVTDKTSMLSVTASHLTTTWDEAFNPRLTETTIFSGTKLKTMPFMSKRETFLYYKDKEHRFKLIRIPLMGYELSLTIVLPISKNLLIPLVNKLAVDPKILKKAKQRTVPTPILLSLPKGSIKSNIDLSKALKMNGINNVFDPDLSITRTTTKNNVFLSKVKQKIFIEFDEFGVYRNPKRMEQAMYNKDEDAPQWGGSPGEQFVADHPFLFSFDISHFGYDYQLLGGVYFGPDAN